MQLIADKQSIRHDGLTTFKHVVVQRHFCGELWWGAADWPMAVTTRDLGTDKLTNQEVVIHDPKTGQTVM
jgi:hypothetical protein